MPRQELIAAAYQMRQAKWTRTSLVGRSRWSSRSRRQLQARTDC